MDQTALEGVIEDAFERRTEIGPDTGGPVRAAVDAALDALDAGRLRVAHKEGGEWRVHDPDRPAHRPECWCATLGPG